LNPDTPESAPFKNPPRETARALYCELVPVTNESDIRDLWITLEQKCSPIFYLSWAWVGRWLNVFTVRGTLAIVREADEVIALGIFVRKKQKRRRGIIRSNQLLLHTTGDGCDAITIEHNGLLCEPNQHSRAWHCILQTLEKDNNWDELIIDSASELTVQALNDKVAETVPTPSFNIDLRAINDMESYLDCLSKNTRSQIRRSIRAYNKRGELKVERPINSKQALQFFADMAEHHIERWTDRGNSVFENKHFIDFHTDMLRNCYERDTVEILRISAGDTPIGWVYNFIQNKRAYFYLGAKVYDEDNRFKPGLVSHALVAMHYLDRGLEVYDLLAGDARYKKSLATQGASISNLIIQRNRTQFRIENSLTNLKNHLRFKRSK